MRHLISSGENRRPLQEPFTGSLLRIRFTIFWGISIFGLLVGSTTVLAQSPAFEMSVKLESVELTVGDPISLEFLVTHTDESHVLFPSIPIKWGEFELIRQLPPHSQKNKDGTLTSTQIVELVMFKPGDYTTPEFEIALIGSDGALYKKTVPGTSVTIFSILQEGDTEIRDIRSQASVSNPNTWPWVVTIILLFAALFLGIFTIIRNNQLTSVQMDYAPDLRTPYQIALDEIRRIEKLNLPAFGQFKEHYTLIAECIRIYLNNGFGTPALDLTTSEIRTALKTSELIDPYVTKTIMILQECDLVKFTRMNPTEQQASSCTLETINLVTDTEHLANGSSLIGEMLT